jgi:hypothetical protein
MMPRRKPQISISIVSTRLRIEECYVEDAQKLAAMPAQSSLIAHQGRRTGCSKIHCYDE